MNKVWFYCEGEAVPDGAFEAVMALRGTPGADDSQCRYGLGDVRSPDFRFCDNDSVPNSPYCEFHHQLCIRPKG